MMKFQPMLLTTMKTYNGKKFGKDVVSGIIVAIVALPLSIALAIASGVNPEQGIYTAIIAGLIISALGGSAVQISGPTAAFATIVAGIVAVYGMDGLIVATIMAGAILIVMGLLRFGALIKFIPYTITTGFTFGIAVTIIVGQIKDFLGLTYSDGAVLIETTEKFLAVCEYITTINWWAVLVGCIALAILIIWPKINKAVPPSLIAVVGGILIVKLFNLPVNTIGDLYEISTGLPTVALPELSWELVWAMLPSALTIAVLVAVESLLSCVVSDEMSKTKHRPNTELVAQGIGNVFSALFGGIPATGAIARTATNVKSGGTTPISGIVHAVVLIIVLVVLMPYAAWIPMPVIAAILFMVAYNMSGWRIFAKLVKTSPKSDTIVLLATCVLTVAFDLVVAIGVGVVVTCLLFMKRLSEESKLTGWKYVGSEETNENKNYKILPEYIRVYEFNGPMFFADTGLFDQIIFKSFTKCLIIRMHGVPALDITAMNSIRALHQTCKDHNVQLIFAHINSQPYTVLRKSGFIDELGIEHFCNNTSLAIEHAVSVVEKEYGITVDLNALENDSIANNESNIEQSEHNS